MQRAWPANEVSNLGILGLGGLLRLLALLQHSNLQVLGTLVDCSLEGSDLLVLVGHCGSHSELLAVTHC